MKVSSICTLHSIIHLRQGTGPSLRAAALQVPNPKMWHPAAWPSWVLGKRHGSCRAKVARWLCLRMVYLQMVILIGKMMPNQWIYSYTIFRQTLFEFISS